MENKDTAASVSYEEAKAAFDAFRGAWPRGERLRLPIRRVFPLGACKEINLAQTRATPDAEFRRVFEYHETTGARRTRILWGEHEIAVLYDA